MPRVTLRAAIDDDIDIFYQHQLDPVARAMAAFTSEDPADRAAFDRHWDRIRGLDTVFLRTVVVDETVLGHVASFMRDEDREVTYWIDRVHWGRGVATAALTAFLEIFTERPIFARAAADNTGSLRVLGKCGFAVVGHERGFANARGQEVEEVVLRLA